MDWKDYEEITKHIYSTLGKQTGVEIICHGNNCKVTGKSGVEHQIDVFTKHSDGLHNYKTAIECKYWDKTINKDIIMKVSEIIEDASINKGVIVSKNGFTPDAISFAKYKNIGLIELREITDEDWEGRIKNIEITLNALLPEIFGVELLIGQTIPSNIKNGQIKIDLLQIKKISGEIIEFKDLVTEFNNELYNKNENEIFEKIYPFDSGAVIIDRPTGEETPINGLKFKGALRIAKDKVEIKGDDHIWLVMKLIFENKSYTISKDKEIRERE